MEQKKPFKSFLPVRCPVSKPNNEAKKSKPRPQTVSYVDKRTTAVRKEQEERTRMRKLGHGQYNIFTTEQQFFDSVMKSDRFVCHFSLDGSEISRILDFHFSKLARLHPETKFASYSSRLCKNILENLCIRYVPTVMMIVNGQIVNRIDFQPLSPPLTLNTEMLEKRLIWNNAAEKRQIPFPDFQDPNKRLTVLYRAGSSWGKSASDTEVESDYERCDSK